MAIGVRSTTSSLGSSINASLPKPATVNNNDLLFAIIGGAAGTTGTYTASGWVKYELNTATGNDVYSGIFYRTVSDASALTGTFTFTGTAAKTYAAFIASLSGVNQSNPEDVTFVGKWSNLQNDTSPNLVSSDTVTAGAVAYAAWVVNADTATTLPGGIWGTTNADDLNGVLNVVSSYFPNAATATGTAELTSISANQESQVGVFIFRPAALSEAKPSIDTVSIIVNSPTTNITYGPGVSYANDPNCEGAWIMTGSTTEPDISNSNAILTPSTPDAIVTSTNVPSGYELTSRDFQGGASPESLYQNDGGSTDISGANQNMSIAAWVNPSALSAGSEPTIVSKYSDAGSQAQYLLFLANRGSGWRAEFIISSSGDLTSTNWAQGASSSGLFSTNTWAHVAAVYDDVKLYVYVNNVLSGTQPSFAGGIANKSARFQIGQRDVSPNGPNSFKGLLNEVILFNKALSTAEISNLYYHGIRGNYNHPTARPSTANITVKVNTATASTSGEIKTTATPTLKIVSILVNAPSTKVIQSRTITPATVLVNVKVNTSTATTSAAASATATPSTKRITVLINSPTLKISQSRIATPNAIVTRILVNQPSVFIRKHANVTTTLSKIIVIAKDALASTYRSTVTFPKNGLLDDFNRADETPITVGKFWSYADSSISSNQMTNSGYAYNSWATHYGPDIEGYITCLTFENVLNDRFGFYFWNNPLDVNDYYHIRWLINPLATDTILVRRYDNNVSTNIATFSQEFSNGSKLGFSAIGNTISVYVDVGGGWTLVGSIDDSTYTHSTSILDFEVAGVVTPCTFDDFGGGTVYPAGILTVTPSTALITISAGQATAKISKSVISAPVIAISSIKVNQPTLITSRSSFATPIIATASVKVNQPTTSIKISAIATPVVKLVNVRVNTAVASTGVSTSSTATPSAKLVSVKINQPVTSTSSSSSSNVNPTTKTVRIQVNTAIASTSFTSSANATASLKIIKVVANSPTTKISISSISTPSATAVRIAINQPSVKTYRSSTSTPSVKNITLLVNSPTVKIIKNVITAPSSSLISIKVLDATGSTFAGDVILDVRILLKSKVETVATNKSRIEKYINNPASIETTSLIKSRIITQINEESEIEKYINLKGTLVN